MRIHLYPKHDDQDTLSPKEIATSLAISMPTVVIDWVRGDEEVERELRRLVEMSAPEAIRDSHRSLFGQTAYVELSFPEFPGRQVHFFVQPHSRITLESNEHEDADMIQHAAEKVSSILGYRFQIAPQ